MKTLQQELIKKLGAKNLPIIKAEKKVKSVKEAICSYPPLGKLKDPNPKTTVTKESTDPSARWNGGDYDWGYDSQDRFDFSWSSCELSMSDYIEYGGYYRNRPVIVQVPDCCWDEESVIIRFPDEKWLKCSEKEWESIEKSPYWEMINNSTLGVTFREGV